MSGPVVSLATASAIANDVSYLANGAECLAWFEAAMTSDYDIRYSYHIVGCTANIYSISFSFAYNFVGNKADIDTANISERFGFVN